MITSVNFCLTSRCNRRCPNCCVGIGLTTETDALYDLSWKQIKEAGEIFGFVEKFNITGGEPSFHKQFKEIAPKLRSTLKCDKLVIESNGYGLRHFPESFLLFDLITITRYGHQYEGDLTNDRDIAFMKKFLLERGLSDKLLVGESVQHYARIERGSNNYCHRAFSGGVSYWNGKIFPCCTAQGMTGGIGIPLTKNWRMEIMEVELPCQSCAFSPRT